MTKTITNGRVTYKGLCYDMLKEMAKTMNFRYSYDNYLLHFKNL